MTVKLSPQKVSQILRYYFNGLPQIIIAKKAAVNQSVVSLYSFRFRKRVAEVGLLAAGREFRVFNEVGALRSLSVELFQAKLTVEDAKQGWKIIRAFMKLGVGTEQYESLIKVCRKVDSQGFVQAAIKLAKIEEKSNQSYEEIMTRFEKVTLELPATEDKLRGKRAKLESINNIVVQKNRELADLEDHIVQLQGEAKTEQTKLESELEDRMKQLKVKQGEVDEIANLKTRLHSQGLDISTLVQIAKEFQT